MLVYNSCVFMFHVHPRCSVTLVIVIVCLTTWYPNERLYAKYMSWRPEGCESIVVFSRAGPIRTGSPE